MKTPLLLLNLLASSASAVAAAIAVIRPASVSNSAHITAGEHFYARMYAVRSIPLGVIAGFLPFWYGGPAVASVLFTAGVVQAADVVIGVGEGDRGMIMEASVETVFHLLCGYVIAN